ncbi:MAG: hypothetical protein AAGI23_00490 [Bacteroidota bacterium]
MSKTLLTELFWWIVTACVTLVILFPIISAGQYRFLWSNVFLIVAFLTLTRYIFLLPQTFLSKIEWLKGAMILFAPILIFLLVQEINRFQTYLDESEWNNVVSGGAALTSKGLSKYIYTEMLFFGVAGVIACLAFPIRMLISIWRVRNLGRE